jgi:flagellar basal-body rod protein FlgB
MVNNFGLMMKINDFLFEKRIPLMNKALDAYSLRMTTSAKNIANVNSVGYKPQRVKFEELFNEQMALQGTKTNEKHIPVGANSNPTGELINREVPSAEIMQSGENDFNIDKEMTEVAQTQIRFQFVSQSMSKHFKQLGAAITGNSNF